MTPLNKEAMMELASRVESATGYDNRLDWEIARACDPSAICRPPEADADEYSVLSYTTSVDAAARLVPEGHFWTVHKHDEKTASALVSTLKQIGQPRVFAATPALALTAACLRALSSQVKS